MPSQKKQRAYPNGEAPVKTSPRLLRRKRDAESQTRSAQEQSMRVTLPGELYEQAGRWWWRTRLPGEERERVHMLQVPGTDGITSDRDAAEKIAVEMWGQAAARHWAQDVTVECERKVERLKAQFLDKVRHLTEIVESANARAQAEAKARVEIEEQLKAKMQAQNPRITMLSEQTQPPTSMQFSEEPTSVLRKNDNPTQQTGICECCGALEIPVSNLETIDSGQRLCPDCLAVLRADITRIEATVFSICPP